jgi:hypothetical protein
MQLAELEEIESHRPQKDCLLNDFDCEIIGDDEDCQLLGSFKPETLLYNLKKEIKVDRSDLGQIMLRNVKTLEHKVKMENPHENKGKALGKTINVKQERRVKAEMPEVSQASTAASVTSTAVVPVQHLAT